MTGGALMVGLTGGIGSGKTTVATALAERGAAVVDADDVARQVVVPGRPAHADLVARFGSGVTSADGTIDRAALAGVVFADARARDDLNAITHPRIRDRMGELVVEALVAGATIIVLDVPLLVPATVLSYHLDAVVVVDTATDLAVERLVAHRGFTEDEARARVASQIDRDERRRLLDVVDQGWVIDNAGDRRTLDAEIDRVWSGLVDLVGDRHR